MDVRQKKLVRFWSDDPRIAAGSPVSALAYDGTSDTVYASLIARRSGTDYWDPVQFSASLTTFCP